MTLRQFLLRERGSDRSCAAMASLRFASERAAGAVAVDSDDIGGVVTGPNGPGGRRLGDRRDHRPADPLHQERGDRRSGPLPHPRSAARRTTRCSRAATACVDSAKVQSEPGKVVNFTATTAPTPEGGRRNLSGDLLVFDAEDAGEARVPARQRQEPGRVAQRRQDQRLLRLSRARQQGDAHDPAGVRRHEVGGRLGAAHPVRAGDEQHGDRHRPHRYRSARSRCSPTGPTASPPASCLPRSRSGRRAGSATSSSRSGISPIPSTTCTTSPRPTSASRRSTPTA